MWGVIDSVSDFSLFDEAIEIAAIDFVQVPFGKCAEIRSVNLVQISLLGTES